MFSVFGYLRSSTFVFFSESFSRPIFVKQKKGNPTKKAITKKYEQAETN